jgi:hypothetical protein
MAETEPLYQVRLIDGTELRKLTTEETLAYLGADNWTDVIPDGCREKND